MPGNKKARPPRALSPLIAERINFLRNVDDEVMDEAEVEQLVENYDDETLIAIDAQITLQNKLDKATSRKLWASVLLILIIAGFVGSYGMILLIGFGILHFADTAFAVPSVVAAGIIQTYGLAKIATKYFFSDDDKTDTK